MEYIEFSRTANGLHAEAIFWGVDVIFRIEGKANCKHPENLPDYIYYNAIIPLFFNESYKILIEGSKTDLKKLSEKLPADNNDHFFFMDRDHDEMTPVLNTKNDNFIFFTLGYSYENDFWTSKLFKKILFVLNPNPLFIENGIRKWKALEKKIAFIHKFNLLSKANGNILFKLKGGCGILFRYDQKLNEFVINKECIDKYKNKWNSFNIRQTTNTKSVNKNLQNKFYAHPGYLIQGHAYEHYILDAINQLRDAEAHLKSLGKLNAFLKDTALLHFKNSPNDYLSDRVIEYYKCIFDKINKLR